MPCHRQSCNHTSWKNSEDLGESTEEPPRNLCGPPPRPRNLWDFRGTLLCIFWAPIGSKTTDGRKWAQKLTRKQGRNAECGYQLIATVTFIWRENALRCDFSLRELGQSGLCGLCVHVHVHMWGGRRVAVRRWGSVCFSCECFGDVWWLSINVLAMLCFSLPLHDHCIKRRLPRT